MIDLNAAKNGHRAMLRTLWLTLGLALAAPMTGCLGDSNADGDSESPELQLVTAGLEASQVARFRVYVTGPQLSAPIIGDFTPTNGRLVAPIQVPRGRRVVFSVVLFDAQGAAIGIGASDVQIINTRTGRIDIEAAAPNFSVKLPVAFGTAGDALTLYANGQTLNGRTSLPGRLARALAPEFSLDTATPATITSQRGLTADVAINTTAGDVAAATAQDVKDGRGAFKYNYAVRFPAGVAPEQQVEVARQAGWLLVVKADIDPLGLPVLAAETGAEGDGPFAFPTDAPIDENTPGVEFVQGRAVLDLRFLVYPSPALTEFELFKNGTSTGKTARSDTDYIVTFSRVVIDAGTSSFRIREKGSDKDLGIPLGTTVTPPGTAAVSIALPQTSEGLWPPAVTAGQVPVYGRNYDANVVSGEGLTLDIAVSATGLVAGASVDVVLDPGTEAEAVFPVQGGQGALSNVTISMTEGQHVLRARVLKDGAIVVNSRDAGLIIDTTPPSVDLRSVPSLFNIATGLARGGRNVRTSIGVGVIEEHLLGLPKVGFGTTSAEAARTATSPQGDTYTFAGLVLDNGQYDLTFTVADYGGNTTTVSKSILSDAIPPGVVAGLVATPRTIASEFRRGIVDFTFAAVTGDANVAGSELAVSYTVQTVGTIVGVAARTVNLGNAPTAPAGTFSGVPLNDAFRVTVTAFDRAGNSSEANFPNAFSTLLKAALVSTKQYPDALTGSSVAAYDFNNDGKTDLFVGGPGAENGVGAIAIYPGATNPVVDWGASGTQQTQPVAFVPTGRAGDGNGSALAVGNFGDARTGGTALQLAVGAAGSNAVQIYAIDPGQGITQFRQAPSPFATVTAPTGSKLGSVLAAGLDLDKDNRPDLLTGLPEATDQSIFNGINIPGGAIAVLPNGQKFLGQASTVSIPSYGVVLRGSDNAKTGSSMRPVRLSQPGANPIADALAFTSGGAATVSLWKPDPSKLKSINVTIPVLGQISILNDLLNFSTEILTGSQVTGSGTGAEFGRGLDAVDINGDRIDDALLVQKRDGSGLEVYPITPQGTFVAKTPTTSINIPASGTERPFFCNVGDLDLDGKPDLLTASSVKSSSGNGSTATLRSVDSSSAIGSEKAAFVVKAVTLTGVEFTSCGSAGDINGDGAPDFWLAAPKATIEGITSGIVAVFY